MPRSAGMLSFPDFRGFTRKLILWNLAVFFGILVLGFFGVSRPIAAFAELHLALFPVSVLHGEIWQLVTYSFLHGGILGTALELLSIWFLGSFLESNHGPRWLAELYFISVAGAGLVAVAMGAIAPARFATAGLTSSIGGTFGLLIAFAVLYGDMEFMMFPLPMRIKAKYLAAVYILIACASFLSGNQFLALAQLGGCVAGYFYVKSAPRRGMGFSFSEKYYGMRNDYYKWKRRRAARKFEVYMRDQHQRDVHFDKDGRYLDPDNSKDPNDRKWMN
jgi:membrane associated rhomboid family serine protease